MRFHRGIPAFIVATAIAAAAAHGGQAQDPAKGAALLAEARKALGGDDKLAAIKRLEVKGTTRRAAGNQSIDGDVELLIELPDKYLRKEELMLLGNGGPVIERIEALNGAETWEKQEGGGFPGRGGFGRGGGRGGGRGDGQQAQAQQPQIDPERLREAQRITRQADFSRLLLAMLLSTDGSVAWVGTAQSPDGTADVLEITPQGGQPMRLLLDASTHVPLMITWDAPRGGGRRGGRAGRGGDQGGAPPPAAAAPAAAPTFQMHLSEYKAVNGVRLPHLITRGLNGETAEELEIKSYKLNPNFKANTFTQDK